MAGEEVMCGGESDRERTGEEVMIYSWRTWLGLSRAAVREERWRWRPGLDQEATGARQCDSLASVRPATTYFLPPTSHHFFSRAAPTGSITATFPRIRPADTPTPRDRSPHCPPTSRRPRVHARSPRPSSPPARHHVPSSRRMRPHDCAADGLTPYHCDPECA